MNVQQACFTIIQKLPWWWLKLSPSHFTKMMWHACRWQLWTAKKYCRVESFVKRRFGWSYLHTSPRWHNLQVCDNWEQQRTPVFSWWYGHILFVAHLLQAISHYAIQFNSGNLHPFTCAHFHSREVNTILTARFKASSFRNTSTFLYRLMATASDSCHVTPKLGRSHMMEGSPGI